MKLIILLINLTYGADAATTTYGIKHGATEVLMPTQNVFTLDSIAAGESIATSLGLVKLNKNHPKAARVLGWSLIAARGFVVYHNMNEVRK